MCLDPLLLKDVWSQVQGQLRRCREAGREGSRCWLDSTRSAGALRAKAPLQAAQEAMGLRPLLGGARSPGQGAPPQLRGCRGAWWEMSLTFRGSCWVRLEGKQALGSRMSHIATSACLGWSLR